MDPLVVTDHHWINPIPSAQGGSFGSYWPSLTRSHPICTEWIWWYLLTITELIPSHLHRVDPMILTDHHWINPICTGWTRWYLLTITESIPSHLHRVDPMILTDHHWIDLLLSANFIMEAFTVFIIIKTHYHDQFFNIQSPLIDSLSLEIQPIVLNMRTIRCAVPQMFIPDPIFLELIFHNSFCTPIEISSEDSFVEITYHFHVFPYLKLWNAVDNDGTTLNRSGTTRKISFTPIV